MIKLVLLGSLLLTNSYAQWPGQHTLHCHTQQGEPFAIVEFYTRGGEWELYRNSHRLPEKGTGHTILYPVLQQQQDHSGEYMRGLGLLSTASGAIEADRLYWDGSIASEHKHVVQESQDYDRLYTAWKRALRLDLKHKAVRYEDIELEYLLSLKFFNEPLPSTFDNWKQNKIFDMLRSFSGLQDVRTAIPLNEKFALAEHQLTEPRPESLSLPKVEVPDIQAAAEDYPLAVHVPRSCYYVEFQSVQQLFTALEFASGQFEQWSPYTYPLSFASALRAIMQNCGIDTEKLVASPAAYGKVAIAGWDPYFQSGTSMLVVLERGDMQGGQYAYEHAGKRIFSNSEKLLAMSQNAFAKQRSLFHDPAFIHARAEINPTPQEQFFLYLSDYWLTNFLSPRWQILNSRLNEADARIRLTEMLRLLEQAESHLQTLPSVAELKQKYAAHEKITWLLRDLSVAEGRVVHAQYGGLYKHPAIDTMPFDKVSVHEKKTYETFANLYRRNWREMDPIAFQINRETDHIRTRLYISPISRLSEFREISQIVLPVKETHRLLEVPAAAFGLSMIFQTTLFRPFSPVGIPQRLQVSARAMDMAPRIENLNSIHQKERKLDPWSYTRMPLMLEAPTLLLNLAMPMVNGQIAASKYPGLSQMTVPEISREWLYNVFFHNDDQGYSRLGINPMPLSAMVNDLGDPMETDIPADIYGYADFVKGYTMHRYLLVKLAENRIYATWRRASRMKRIEQMVGQAIDEAVFPQPGQRFSAYGIPDPADDNTRRSSNPSNKVKNLPDALHNLEKVEVFVAVHANALQFDTKLKFIDATEPSVNPPPLPEMTEPLDFDAE